VSTRGFRNKYISVVWPCEANEWKITKNGNRIETKRKSAWKNAETWEMDHINIHIKRTDKTLTEVT